MEVHHHPHVEKKSFKEYILEGLMIFLAVCMGFAAETLREHLTEKERETVYMENMAADLRTDTHAYTNFSKNLTSTLQMIDSLSENLSRAPDQINTNKAYYFARLITSRFDKLVFNERTYEQMKSSGDLRLIHSRAVSDSVSTYYNLIKVINSQNNTIDEKILSYMNLVHSVFDARTMMQIFKERKEPVTARLLSTDKKDINRILMSLQYVYGTFVLLNKWGAERDEKAKKLLSLIEKEYHLVNE